MSIILVSFGIVFFLGHPIIIKLINTTFIRFKRTLNFHIPIETEVGTHNGRILILLSQHIQYIYIRPTHKTNN